jgi:hypothetical protein
VKEKEGRMSQTSPKSHPVPAFALPKVCRAVSANIYSFPFILFKIFLQAADAGFNSINDDGP